MAADDLHADGNPPAMPQGRLVAGCPVRLKGRVRIGVQAAPSAKTGKGRRGLQCRRGDQRVAAGQRLVHLLAKAQRQRARRRRVGPVQHRPGDQAAPGVATVMPPRVRSRARCTCKSLGLQDDAARRLAEMVSGSSTNSTVTPGSESCETAPPSGRPSAGTLRPVRG